MSEYAEKLRSLSFGSRTRKRVVEGREHPESGLPFKATTDELNNTVTEHSVPGTGVACRQDVNIRPRPIRMKLEVTNQ